MGLQLNKKFHQHLLRNHSKDDIHPIGLLASAIQNGMKTPNYLVELDTNGQYKFKISLKEPTEIGLQ